MTSTRIIAGGLVVAALAAGVWLLQKTPEDDSLGLPRAAAAEAPGTPPPAAAPGPAPGTGPAGPGIASVPFAPPEEGPPAAGSSRARDPEDWTAVAGRCVRAEDGAPLAGCTITITGHQSTGHELAWAHPDWRDPEPAVSAADGSFRVRLGLTVWEAPSAGWSGRIHVTVEHPGRTPCWGSISLPELPAGGTKKVGDVALVRGAARRFRVVDEAGDPVAGCAVWVRRILDEPADPYAPERIRTRDGVYESTGPDGFVDGVAVFRPGRWLASTRGRELAGPEAAFDVGSTLEPASPLTLVVKTIARATAISGRVRDQSGAPKAGVRVEGAWSEPLEKGVSRSRSTPTVATGADGSFLLDAAAAPAGTKLVIQVAQQRRYDGWLRLGNAEPGTHGLELVMRSSGSLAVQALTEEGLPVAEFALRCAPDRQQDKGATARLSVRHPEGRAEVAGLQPGPHRLKIIPTDERFAMSAPIPVEVPESGSMPVEVRIAKSAARTIELRDAAGSAIAGSRVELLSGGRGDPLPDELAHPLSPDSRGWTERVFVDAARTGAGGRAVLRGPATGDRVWLRALGPGHLPAVQAVEGWSGDAGPLVLTVAKGGTVRGTVLPLAVLEALDASAPTDVPSMRLRDPARMRPYTAAGRVPGEELRPRIVALEPGSLDTDPGSVAAQVRRDLTNAVGPVVRASGRAARPAEFEALVDSGGGFELRDLPPGRWSLHLLTFESRPRREAMRRIHPEALAEVLVGPDSTSEVVLDVARMAPAGPRGQAALDGAPAASAMIELFDAAPSEGGDGRRPLEVAVVLRTDGAGALLPKRVAPGTYTAVLLRPPVGADPPLRIPASAPFSIAEEGGLLELRFETRSVVHRRERGLKTGPWIHWHVNGRKHSEGVYGNDLRTGLWTFWKPDGAPDPELTGTYAGGRRVAR